MLGIKGSFKYYLIALILILILSACERPLQSDDNAESDAVATEEVVTAVAEAEAVLEHEEQADEEDTSAATADVAAGDAEEGDTEAGDAEAGDADTGNAEAADTDVEEVEAETEPVTEEAEAGAESPRPTDGEADTDAATSEVDESTATDPNVGGGTPDTAEEAPATEAGETETAVEAAEEPEAATEESMSEAGTTDTDAADATGDSAAGEAATETQTDSETAAVPVESALPATHTVQPGENLYRIGLQYGLSWVALARYNNIYNPNYIYVGQVLQIPGGSTPPPPPPVPDPVPPVENPPNYVNYTVKPGDTLAKIGQAFGVRPEVIAEVNGIVNPNLIYAGQVLKIPTSSPETPPATTHVVKQGETLYRISLQYGVHWLSIAQVNNIWPPYVIYAGQTLVIPGG